MSDLAADTATRVPSPNGVAPSTADGVAPPAEHGTLDQPAEHIAAIMTGQIGPRVAGHEIVRELGRGAMAVVYLARQVEAHRLVALKMPLTPLASVEERARFLAEALGNAKHPNVVEVHGLGEADDGWPYFALEYLPGGTLAERLKDGKPLDARLAAEWIEKLARGLNAAHAVGVVHRDLKPSNIMFDAAGEPKVTDFGVAKRATALDMTHTTQHVGTPFYMSPEQATGRSKYVGPESDVFSLGVMLYECLTRTRPFGAGNAGSVTTVELYQQIATATPTRPRGHDPAIPQDLETVCLKCLEKAPGQRYASAEALADDLRRFRAGERVLARPVGRLTTAWRWCRKNPTVAGLLLAVVVLIAGGTAGISLKYLDAKEQKDRADEKTWSAERSERATAAALERAEEILADGAIRALRTDEMVIEPQELEALNDIAGLTDDRPRTLLVARGLTTDANAIRLEKRRAGLVRAAVGLDANRCRIVEVELATLMANETVSLARRKAAAWLVSELPASPDRLNREAAKLLADALGKETEAYARLNLAEGLGAVSARLEPADAAKTLADAFGKERNASARWQLARGLGAVSARLEPADAAKTLADTFGKETDANARWWLAEGLAAVAARLEPAHAARLLEPAAQTLADALGKATDAFSWRLLAEGLAAVSARLEPANAAKAVAPVASLLANALGSHEGGVPLQELVEGLAVVAARLAPADAKLLAPAAQTLADALRKETHARDRGLLAQGLAAVSAWLEPADAAKTLADAFGKEKDASARWQLARGLAAVSARLEPADAARLSEPAAQTLANALRKEKDASARWQLARGLAAVSARLEPADAVKLLAEALAKATDLETMRKLAQVLAGISATVPGPEAITLLVS